MAAYELKFIDFTGSVAGETREIDGLDIDSVHERAVETLMTMPDVLGFELYQEGRELRRFVKKFREID